MKQFVIFGLILSSLPGGAQTNTELRGPMNGWLSDAVALATVSSEEAITGEGRVRRLRDIATAKIRVFTDPTDGKTVLLRVANEGAAGVRLHFENMHLAKGARMFVYGVSETNQVVASHGPFTGTGPLQSGEFWTRAMAGTAVIIEVQLNGELASLPFDLDEMALTDSVEESSTLSASAPAAERRTSLFRGMAVDHTVVDGFALWQGDIILGRAEELQSVPSGRKAERDAGSLNGTAYKWPNGVMPYTIDPTLPNQARITSAIAHWNTKLDGHVKLVPRTDEAYYVYFRRAAATTCSSYLGMTRQAAQPINIGEYCSTGNTIHEIGHAFGLYHEQTRSDRDEYVKINMENVEPAARNNFARQNSANWGGYDYSSIMHYGAYDFSINDEPTIETIPAGIRIGQRTSLSTGDIAGVQEMYPSSEPPAARVDVTFSSNPAGRILTVDGSNDAAPRTIQWDANSSHTISAPNQTTTSIKYLFKQWSDGGAQTHDVTAPDAATTYTATYNQYYKLTLSATEGGRVSASPAPADRFYAANSVVTLTATADPNYCLASWGGLIPVSSYAVAVTLSRPADVTANFQVGVVTVPTSATASNEGGLVRVNIGATSGCLWRAVSQANWITIEGASTGSASAPLTLKIEAGTPGTRRTGSVIVNSRRITVTQVQ